jgi:hypothetical protein
MKKLRFVCLAAFLALMPRTASAQEVCQIVGSGTEQICYTGVFPSNPIIIELGQSIRLPPTTNRNLTNRTIEFTIEWAGIDIPGSAVIDRRQLGRCKKDCDPSKSGSRMARRSRRARQRAKPLRSGPLSRHTCGRLSRSLPRSSRPSRPTSSPVWRTHSEIASPASETGGGQRQSLPPSF